LRCYTLVCGVDPVAFAIGYQYESTYYFEETAYCNKWGDFGPGNVLFHLFVEDLMQIDRPQLLDFILGDQSYKRSYSNRQGAASSMYLAPRNRWRLFLRLQSASYKMERIGRRCVTTLGLERRLRRLFKHNS